ncbi:MAG: glycosyltransferase [Blautia sp.]
MLDKVIFAGVCPDVERYLSAMDVFFFPSLFEGLPFTLLEAQANGLPCVVSDRITEEAVIYREDYFQTVPGRKADEVWASAVIVAAKKGREDKEAAVRAIGMAHFDIHQEAGRLLGLYQGEKHGKQN